MLKDTLAFTRTSMQITCGKIIEMDTKAPLHSFLFLNDSFIHIVGDLLVQTML